MMFVLADRSHGKEFCKQFEDSCIKIEDYVNTLEREITQRKTVLMMCENSEIFYDEQFKEAKIVANVSIVNQYYNLEKSDCISSISRDIAPDI